MNKLTKLFLYARWPALTGLVIALTILALFPELNPRAHKLSHSLDAPIQSYADAVATAMPSVVNIYEKRKSSTRRHPILDHPYFKKFFRERESESLESLGSGIIVDEGGFILTNSHVIDGVNEIVVVLQDGRKAYSASALKLNFTNADLALFKISLSNLTPIELADPREVRVGDVVLAIGNPFGYGHTVTKGIVSAMDRQVRDISAYGNIIQTDAAVNPGNSGGALVDTKGRLVGITTSYPSIDGFTGGISFAIPVYDTINYLRDALEHRGWIGLNATLIDGSVGYEGSPPGTRGFMVLGVVAGGPAHVSGLKRGDLIVKVNNLAVDGKNDEILVQQFSRAQPGERLELELMRDGKSQVVEIVVGEMPSN